MAEHIPVVKVRDILLVTMPADPGDAAISRFQEAVTEAAARHQPHGVVVDLSSVDAIDSYFARTLMDTGRMVGLLGSRLVICGMRPSAAITITQLGLTLSSVATSVNVDTALDKLERLTKGAPRAAPGAQPMKPQTGGAK